MLVTHCDSFCSFSSAVWKGSPSVRRQAPTKTALSARRLTSAVRSSTVTAALPPPVLGAPRAWPPPAQPAWPGLCERATNLRAWPYASKRKRRTRDARPFRTVMSSQQTCRIRRLVGVSVWQMLFAVEAIAFHS